MTHNRFFDIKNEMQKWQDKTLDSKGGEYATEDRLHNFKAIAHRTGQTPMQVCYSLMDKHLVALADKIFSEEPMSKEFFDEKTGDPYNYIVLLRALYEDEQKEILQVQKQIKGK